MIARCLHCSCSRWKPAEIYLCGTPRQWDPFVNDSHIRLQVERPIFFQPRISVNIKDVLLYTLSAVILILCKGTPLPEQNLKYLIFSNDSVEKNKNALSKGVHGMNEWILLYASLAIFQPYYGVLDWDRCFFFTLLLNRCLTDRQTSYQWSILTTTQTATNTWIKYCRGK